MTYRTAPDRSPEGEVILCPVEDADAFFPRPHPSAGTTRTLGLLAVYGLGPLAGVPAILLGRRVAREIAEAGGIYTGARDARGGEALGWVGTTLWCAAILGWLTKSWIAGISAIAVGLAIAMAARRRSKVAPATRP